MKTYKPEACRKVQSIFRRVWLEKGNITPEEDAYLESLREPGTLDPALITCLKYLGIYHQIIKQRVPFLKIESWILQNHPLLAMV